MDIVGHPSLGIVYRRQSGANLVADILIHRKESISCEESAWHFAYLFSVIIANGTGSRVALSAPQKLIPCTLTR